MYRLPSIEDCWKSESMYTRKSVNSNKNLVDEDNNLDTRGGGQSRTVEMEINKKRRRRRKLWPVVCTREHVGEKGANIQGNSSASRNMDEMVTRVPVENIRSGLTLSLL